MLRFLHVTLGLALAASLLPGEARAQEAAPPPKVVEDAGSSAEAGKTEATEKIEESVRPDGWSPGIAIGASFNLVNTRSVVGQQDGTSIMLGGAIDASLEFNSGIHEWRNALGISAGTTRTPSIDEFIKTNDGLAFETIYLIHIIEIFGPFARFGLNTQMFPGYDIEPSAVDYVVANLDQSTTSYTGRRLALTDPFDPLTLRESVGVFVQPVRMDEIQLEARAGIGAQEIFAHGLAVQDDSATPFVDVKELDDSWQVGGEAVVNAWGFVDPQKRISYSAGIGVLVPFAASELPPGDDRSLPELTIVEGLLGLNVKLFDWASVSYKLTVLRQPMLVDAWQITNSLLVTVGAAFGSKAPVPPPPPPCDCPALPPPAAAPAAPEPAPAAPAEAPAEAPAPAPPPAEPIP
jgi:DUF3078 family protein